MHNMLFTDASVFNNSQDITKENYRATSTYLQPKQKNIYSIQKNYHVD